MRGSGGVGGGGSFGAGRRSLCGAASWTYKELGAGEVGKGGAIRGQRGVSGKLRGAWFLRVRRGRGARLSARSRIQTHSSGTPGLPFTSSANAPLVCDMDTSPALLSQHQKERFIQGFFFFLGQRFLNNAI